MIRHYRGLARVSFLCVPLLLLPAMARAQSDCVLRQVARIPMGTNADGLPTVPMTINGRTVTMTVATTNMLPELNMPTALALGLDPEDPNRSRWRTNDGEAISRFAVAQGVQMGGMTADHMEFALLPGGKLPTDVDGALSSTILKAYDVELDFANGIMSLYSPDHCPGQFSHWSKGDYAVVKIEVDRVGRISLPLNLDGKEIRGVLDTASTRTATSLEEITYEFGYAESDPDMKEIPGGSDGVHFLQYPFKELSIQGIAVKKPKIALVAHDQPRGSLRQRNITLGLDIIRRLHLYIAYNEQIMYVTPATAQ